MSAAPIAHAQDAPVRVRGTIGRVEGDLYIVKARGGAELKVKLPDNVMVVSLTAAATKLPDGTLRSPRVNVGRGVAPM
jgi:hypothetical protein